MKQFDSSGNDCPVWAARYALLVVVIARCRIVRLRCHCVGVHKTGRAVQCLTLCKPRRQHLAE